MIKNNLNSLNNLSGFNELAQGKWQGMPSIWAAPKMQGISRVRYLLSMPAYYWIIISQLLVMLVFIGHLPIWLIGLGVLSALSQLPSVKHQVANKMPLKRRYLWVQLALFFGGLAGLWVSMLDG